MSSILTEESFGIVTHSPTQTFGIGEKLGNLLVPGDVICLEGQLGSGKTLLTQGIGAGLTVVGVINSPTFVFVNEYPPANEGPYLYHIDLYRICDLLDVLSLGLEDYVYSDGVTVIEWADRAAEFMPEERLWITLTYTDYTDRSLALNAAGEHYLELLHALKQALG